MTFISEMKQILKNNWIFYLIGAAFCIGLKLYYRSVDSCGLMWILTPTARWAGILGGYAFENLPHTGYVNHDLQFIIAKSCSGVQFTAQGPNHQLSWWNGDAPLGQNLYISA